MKYIVYEALLKWACGTCFGLLLGMLGIHADNGAFWALMGLFLLNGLPLSLFMFMRDIEHIFEEEK